MPARDTNPQEKLDARRKPVTRARQPAAPLPLSPGAAILALQRQVGNAAVAAAIDARLVQRSVKDAYDRFSGEGSCSCGEDLGNNCAHYLSDAFIRAGYSELDGGKGALYRKRKGRVVCKHGRPVRAREMEPWFKSKAEETHKGNPGDKNHWAVWQGGGGYWGGHVAIHKHKGKGQGHDARGTGDYPDWPTQNHYRW